ncbi:hypothetical protein [Candidatus Borrarchaeum sp.]|uniref:hypothetical protein n=1 Tax=Candidatus Borrarchaeum sp. TaxID=2846742 RepID=UPI00257AAD90|nr:hypothetical protein [Candidatus Borrarchaeum sp.]
MIVESHIDPSLKESVLQVSIFGAATCLVVLMYIAQFKNEIPRSTSLAFLAFIVSALFLFSSILLIFNVEISGFIFFFCGIGGMIALLSMFMGTISQELTVVSLFSLFGIVIVAVIIERVILAYVKSELKK